MGTSRSPVLVVGVAAPVALAFRAADSTATDLGMWLAAERMAAEIS